MDSGSGCVSGQNTPQEPGDDSRPPTPALTWSVTLLVLGGFLTVLVIAYDHVSTRPGHEVATHQRDYETLCEGRPIPGAPAYTGSGVRPILVFEDMKDHDPRFFSRVDLSFGLEPDRVYDPDADGVQLVACAERVDEGEQVGTCEYGFHRSLDGADIPLHLTDVEIRIYEARTGEPVGEPLEVVARDKTCPRTASYNVMETERAAVYTTPATDQYIEAIEEILAD